MFNIMEIMVVLTQNLLETKIFQTYFFTVQFLIFNKNNKVQKSK